MKKTLLFSVIFLLLVSMTFVSSLDATTKVKLRTDDYLATIVTRLMDPNTNDAVFDTVNVKTDAIGRANFEFDTSRKDVKFLFLFVEDSEVVKKISSEEYTVGGIYELDYRGEVDEAVEVVDEVPEGELNGDIEEEVVDEVLEVIIETEENQTGFLDKTISGFAVVKDKIVGVNPWFYYIFAMLLVGGLVTVFVMKGKEPSRDPDVEFHKEEPKNIVSAEEKVANAEEQLRKAREDLEGAQGQEARQQKIQDMKDRIQRDKERLDNLEKQE